MTKRIGILTLPIGANVGGVLQAFALNFILIGMGYDVETLKNYSDRQLSKRILCLYRIFVEYYQRRFIRRYIRRSKIVIRDEAGFEKIGKLYDALITGSDQVWREECTGSYYYYYYLALAKDCLVKKIAYAASFGIGPDEWQADNERVEKLRRLVLHFTGISVREDSGIDICRRFYDGKVLHVLDPTMLLSKDTYLFLCSKILKNLKVIKPHLFAYILDDTADKWRIIRNCADTASLGITAYTERKKIKNLFLLKDLHIAHYMFPSVEQWLANFAIADFIVTDSFHGTVFSILFNKQFIVVANKDRGQARFDSLLRMFGLQDRLVHDYEDYVQCKWETINYSVVNEILEQERKKSLAFLKECLRDE